MPELHAIPEWLILAIIGRYWLPLPPDDRVNLPALPKELSTSYRRISNENIPAVLRTEGS